MNIVNRYKLKDGVRMGDILAELSSKHLRIGTHGTYIHEKAKYCTSKNLVDEIEVCIAFPENLSKWNDFDYILVMDDDFGRPYQPFYRAAEHENHRFAYVLNVIGNYNKFMDTLRFLERIYEDEQ